MRHDLDVSFSNVVTVFDGIHAGLNRIVHTVQRHGMRSHLVVLAMGLIHNRAQLIEGEGGNVIEYAVRADEVTTVRINFDPVSAKADLLAHGLAAILSAVHHLHAVRHRHFRRISQQWISAGNVHGARGDPHARPGNDSVIDGLLQVDVGVTCAFCFQIADGSKPILKRAAH